MSDEQDPKAGEEATVETPPDPAQELRDLSAGLRTHLGWLASRGQRWAPSTATPRYDVEVAPEYLVSPAEGGETGSASSPGEPAAAGPPSAPFYDEPKLDPEAEALAHPGFAADGLRRVRELLGDCKRCRLAVERTQIVFGQGQPDAHLMFIGEGPGRDEDLQGEAFVGAAGKLLTKMIKAMGYSRDQVFITNIVKCRPPENRDPRPDETATCLPFLEAQIRAVQPAVIVTLGRPAANTLLDNGLAISRLRGSFQRYHIDDREIPLMPTFHPAYLLRNEEMKRPVWEDLKQVMAFLQQRGLH